MSLKQTSGYKAIAEFYGDRTARRSGVRLMNHIDEGLIVLDQLHAGPVVKEAFCIHPLCQDDEALRLFQPRKFDVMVVMLAMEYRNVANRYLASAEIGPYGIKLSPLEEVNQMLIADKVQNRKDFLIHHAQTHPNRQRLDEYFREWLRALDVSERQYRVWAHLITG